MQPTNPAPEHAHQRSRVTLSVDDLWVTYMARRGTVKAVAPGQL